MTHPPRRSALIVVITWLIASCSGVIDDGIGDVPSWDAGSATDAGRDSGTDTSDDSDVALDGGLDGAMDADIGADADDIALPDIPVVAPTFDDVVALFTVECAPCHTDRVSGELSLRDDAGLYDRLLGSSFQAADMARVTPGNPDASYLWLKLNDRQGEVGGAGEFMPLDGVLRADQLETIEGWIRDGAPR